MKKYIIILLFSIFILMNITSCSKYLDVQDDFSASDSVDFVLTDNPAQARRFHGGIYNALPNYSAYTGGDRNGMQNPWVCLSDDMVAYLNGNLKTTPINGYLATNAPHHRWDQLYKVIRICNVFLEKAKPIGRVGESDSINEEELKRLKAEAFFFRAYSHYLLFELYGPITIMSGRVIHPSQTDIQFERNSVDEVVADIVKDIEQALEGLYETHYIGDTFDEKRIVRPTKGVALALKAKILTLAASPLYNGEYTEALSIINNNGKRLFPDKDPNKWEKAKEALEAFFAYANQGHYELYKSANNDPHLNVYEVFQRYNKEIIWANAIQNWKDVEFAQTPRDIQVPSGNALAGTIGVPQETVDAFFMANGLKITDPNSGYIDYGKTNVENPATLHTPQGGTAIRITDPNISNMYAKREPRFYASIMYQGRSWHDITTNRKMQNKDANLAKATRVFFSKDISSTSVDKNIGYREKVSSNNTTGGYPTTGYLAYKFNNRTIHPTLGGANKEVYRTSIIFRLADFYLLYAEVLNEINPNDPKIVEYLDKIRERAGIPGYQKMATDGIKTGIIGNQQAMREAIHLERRIELFAEGQRYFDVRRWLVADKEEGRQGGYFKGMNMNGNESDGTFYQKVNNDPLPRKFERRMYLYPIPYTEIQNNRGTLVQNPGW
ncbi:RagB/SusD family nutrient uptake outer membrane protein [Capnocytophaga catalasegens]|uniref:RagB/SusD family nutrient uptake outer membrane protein n=1 Tax=Capnocytophaga catalasegens TaxID=1004260 RepID=A0AAV5AW73_9FLAO|nr:RagB/SusD family nutrient uptake outer membrane protein [Capnocytophaga catalasegens]GIZ14386.1 hypothetical protein RCZ03_03870 [Capnocytophaga catalasegens]GJM51506.1 hypothetical protein RCZ15_24790 [Capnocytophaga catalasegens]GJM53410.1 hypothetical protein RCZ16_17270 [Capnocytophaga catalasegens]